MNAALRRSECCNAFPVGLGADGNGFTERCVRHQTGQQSGKFRPCHIRLTPQTDAVLLGKACLYQFPVVQNVIPLSALRFR